MKLSDAMRAGAKLSRQLFYELTLTDHNGGVSGTCAIGAAVHGMGLNLLCGWRDPLNQAFPELLDRKENCPIRGCVEEGNLHSTIVHLNNYHRWSREKIAGWLDEFVLLGPKPVVELAQPASQA